MFVAPALGRTGGPVMCPPIPRSRAARRGTSRASSAADVDLPHGRGT